MYQHCSLVRTTHTSNDFRVLRIMFNDAEDCCRVTEALSGPSVSRINATVFPTESTQNQDTTTASCAEEERFRDFPAFAEPPDRRHMPIARLIASLTHSAASWSSKWPAVGWCR
jgi:hypothetical protein